MTRRLPIILLASLTSLVAAAEGCGGGGHSSTPVLLSVSPEVGSPLTRFTITGKGLSRNPKSSHVLFDGVPAQVVAVGTGSTPTIVVVASSFQLSAAQSVDVTVNHSNPIAITLEPSGTARPAPAPVFSTASSLAQGNGVAYLVDAAGAWSVDLSTREIRCIARSFTDGWQRISAVWRLSDNTVYLADVSVTSSGRLFKQTATGWQLIMSTGQPIDALARNAVTGDLYFTHSITVGRIPASSSAPSFSATLGENAGDAVFQNSLLFVTQPGAGKIVSVDPTNGNVADFKTGLTDTSALAGDGSNLFSVAGNAIDEISAAGVVTTFFSGSFNSAPSRLAQLATGTLLVSAGDAPVIYSVASGATEATAVLGGVSTGVSFARAPGEFLLADNLNGVCGKTGDAALGGFLLGVRDDGTAHVVSSKACVLPEQQVVGNEVYFADAGTGISKLDLTSDTVTAITTTADGFTATPISVAVAPDGTVYAGYFDQSGPGTGEIATVSPSGTVNRHFVDIAEGGPLSLAVSGSRLWWARILPDGSTTVEIDTVPLSGGTPTTVSSIAPAFDGIVPDGEGGVYAADTLGLGALWHLHADGTQEELGTSPSGPLLAFDQDPLTGQIFGSTFFGSITNPSTFVTLDP